MNHTEARRVLFFFICVECSQTFWSEFREPARVCIFGGRIALWPGKEIIEGNMSTVEG